MATSGPNVYTVTAKVDATGKYAHCSYTNSGGSSAKSPLPAPSAVAQFNQVLPSASGLQLVGAMVTNTTTPPTTSFVPASITEGKLSQVSISVPNPSGLPQATRGVVLVFSMLNSSGVPALYPSSDPQIQNPGT
ncbi:hypothetical protein RQP53_11825 [Paucibacter sp. APW11]|uniref:Uncharacterized protein n=1 Tax=Roseateles aquae TaxID=3077235 RepID=A0ABU3PCS6_9BURK|nr:hypothetical protein [Paucibacter sp. APW11]MDT8999953.1 hypothetical protein [Paucibacter sp. APW11]